MSMAMAPNTAFGTRDPDTALVRFGDYMPMLGLKRDALLITGARRTVSRRIAEMPAPTSASPAKSPRASSAACCW